jgi:hypothetical protein
MRDLLVTKSSNGDCSIMNNFFSRFIANCYTIVFSNIEFYLSNIFYISEKNDYF